MTAIVTTVSTTAAAATVGAVFSRRHPAPGVRMRCPRRSTPIFRAGRVQCRRRPSFSRASSGPTTLAPISSTIRTTRSTSSALEASTPRLR